MEKYVVNKGMFDKLVKYVMFVWNSFNPKEFPEETKKKLIALKNYLDETFIRKAIITGSDEYSIVFAFSEGLQENCIENQIFSTKDFVEARKNLNNEINILTKRFLELRNHPIHNWESFKLLLKIAPVWEK